jgi:hypothetical protein
VIATPLTLRDAIVLVKVGVKPHSKPARGNWKEVCRSCLQVLQRCVYVDKDLVLPPMNGLGPEQTFFVVASTDLTGAEIMMTRVREQLGSLPQLKTGGEVEVSASAVPMPDRAEDHPLEEQVRQVADHVTGMIRAALAPQSTSSPRIARRAT